MQLTGMGQSFFKRQEEEAKPSATVNLQEFLLVCEKVDTIL